MHQLEQIGPNQLTNPQQSPFALALTEKFESYTTLGIGRPLVSAAEDYQLYLYSSHKYSMITVTKRTVTHGPRVFHSNL